MNLKSSTFLGIVLIVIGFAVSLLWYWLFGLPIYTVGVFFLVFSKVKLTTKLVWTLVPLIVFYPLGLLIRSGNNATPETFLIPSTFKGKFRVIYGEECGLKTTVENGRQVLSIPPDGILILKNKIEEGWRDQAFYFVTPDGSKELAYLNDKKINKSVPNIIVIGPAVATYNFETSNHQKLTYSYVDFEVIKENSIIDEPSPERNAMDSLSRAKLMECKSN
jgi:hypothetical protein